MRELDWSGKCHALLAILLIKLGKLTHDQFTEQELSTIANAQLPLQFALPIPIGSARLELIKAQVTMPLGQTRIIAQCLAALQVQIMGSVLYRAHVVIIASVLPSYDRQHARVQCHDVKIEEVRLINDDYALLNDTTHIIKKMMGTGVLGLVTQPLQGALSMLSQGITQPTLNYLNLYLSGSKQRVLDYHLPAIHAAIMDTLAEQALDYHLQPHIWREYVFRLYGKQVRVQNRELRFEF